MSGLVIVKDIGNIEFYKLYNFKSGSEKISIMFILCF